MQCRLIYLLRPIQGVAGTGGKGHLFQGNRDKGKILRGTGKRRQYWRTGNINKQIFYFWETGEQANLIQGNRYYREGLSNGYT